TSPLFSYTTLFRSSYFLYQNPDARGTYKNVLEFKDYILNDEDLKQIENDKKLRELVKGKGISQDPKDPNYFNGKYIIPYEKGGESDTDNGWLPNYQVPNNYYINWSEKYVKDLWDARNNNSNKSTLRNQHTWFKTGLTFSLTGYYAPTVRLKTPSMFDNKSSGIFSEIDRKILLG